MLRLAASLALVAMLLVPGTVMGHDETPFGDFLTDTQAIIAAWSIDDMNSARDDALVTASALRSMLLETVPQDCYVEAYATEWELYAALMTLWRGGVVDTQTGVDAITALLPVVREAIAAHTCQSAL